MQAIPDYQHWHEIDAQADKAYKENTSSFLKELDLINQDTSTTSIEERKEKTNALWNEYLYRRDKITTHRDQVTDLIVHSKESQNGVVAQL